MSAKHTPGPERGDRCKAVLARGQYTNYCSRKAKRNGYCAFHDNRQDDDTCLNRTARHIAKATGSAS